MNKGIPINPAILKWARERAGYSIEQLKKAFPKLVDWESGALYPTYSQLAGLAERYKITIAVLFFSVAPKETAIEKSLRAISATNLINLSPTVRFLFRKGEAFQIYLRELYEDNVQEQEQKISWLNNIGDGSPSHRAKEVRKHLKISIDTQISWKSEDDALLQWREALAENGVYVFKEAFDNGNISGFCIYDKLFPIIFINSSQSKSRQIFTACHELCHLISKENFLDTLDQNEDSLNITESSSEEAKCNSFAGHLLVPDVDINARYDTEGLDNNLDRLSNLYKVSKNVILRKLLELSKIDRSVYEDKVHQWNMIFQKNNKVDKKSSGGNYYATKFQYIGKSYCSLVFKKYYQGKFDIDKASEYLDIKPKSFAGMEVALLNTGSNNVYF